MEYKVFPVIDMAATGKNIVRIRQERGLTVKEVQRFFCFENPQAIYKWQNGQTLPTVDNLLALSELFNVRMDDILVWHSVQTHDASFGQPAQDGCPVSLFCKPYVQAIAAA